MPISLFGLLLVPVLAFSSWRLVEDASHGGRWITLKRRSRRSPEKIWSDIEKGWTDHALTFEPVRILPDSTDTLKSFALSVDDREYRTSLQRLPPSAPRSLTITCVKANGQPYPLGRHHRKIWRVEPNGAGSMIHVAVTFQAPPFAIMQAIFTFSRQLRLLAGR
ncbi:hypothetical protein [Gellertiella hungarica]|uniref:SRPBCC family protein n=1 Tax=Gellertiella hungarica TaxID=1572859 RepID=A0A7W6NKS3_9HYPH|nr:hypothetical protein [Gellertiella hungarica]MBB4064582.1 hypothetical protein [Gellertiella hungarica]